MTKEEEIALRAVIDALDYFNATSPEPRGHAWKQVRARRNELAEVRQRITDNSEGNPFALGHD